jgi:hypothetical protein
MTSLSPDDDPSSPELDPPRMLEGAGGEQARSLLASARLDRVPSSAKGRVAAALGGVLEPNGALPYEPGRAGRGHVLSRLAARSGLYIVGTGVVAAIALALWQRSSPGESANVSSTTPAVSAPPPGPGAPEAATPGADSAVRGSRTAPEEPSAATQPSQPTRRSKPARRAAPTPHGAPAERQVPSPVVRATPQRSKPEGDVRHGDVLDSGLLAEVRAVEAVNSAIGAGHAGLAARELEAYRKRFPRGELAVEADVLQIQIATSSGDYESARVHAERLLARPEAQHYRARVLALLEETSGRAGSTNRENAGRSRSNDAAADMRARR